MTGTLVEHQCVAVNIKIHPHSIIAILAHDVPIILATLPVDQQVIRLLFKITFLYINAIGINITIHLYL